MDTQPLRRSNTDQSYQSSGVGGHRKGGPSGRLALQVCKKVGCCVRKVAASARALPPTRIMALS